MGKFRATSLIAVLFTALMNAQPAPIQTQQQNVPAQASTDSTLRFDVA
jgi:hypothetical protein